MRCVRTIANCCCAVFTFVSHASNLTSLSAADPTSIAREDYVAVTADKVDLRADGETVCRDKDTVLKVHEIWLWVSTMIDGEMKQGWLPASAVAPMSTELPSRADDRVRVIQREVALKRGADVVVVVPRGRDVTVSDLPASYYVRELSGNWESGNWRTDNNGADGWVSESEVRKLLPCRVVFKNRHTDIVAVWYRKVGDPRSTQKSLRLGAGEETKPLEFEPGAYRIVAENKHAGRQELGDYFVGRDPSESFGIDIFPVYSAPNVASNNSKHGLPAAQPEVVYSISFQHGAAIEAAQPPAASAVTFKINPVEFRKCPRCGKSVVHVSWTMQGLPNGDYYARVLLSHGDWPHTTDMKPGHANYGDDLVGPDHQVAWGREISVKDQRTGLQYHQCHLRGTFLNISEQTPDLFIEVQILANRDDFRNADAPMIAKSERVFLLRPWWALSEH